MSLGKMNTTVEIGIFKSIKDAEGFATSVYEGVASVRAFREGRHGSQRWANLAAFSDATDLFRIRTIPGVDISTDHILLCNGEKYDIISVEDVRGRGMYLEIMARKVVPTRG